MENNEFGTFQLHSNVSELMNLNLKDSATRVFSFSIDSNGGFLSKASGVSTSPMIFLTSLIIEISFSVFS